jgi:hypothetical protein
LNRTKKAVLAITAIAALAAPIVIGIMNAPLIRAQSGARPQFEVASLKPNPGCEKIPFRGNLSPSPGLLEMPCATLEMLIRGASTYRNTGWADAPGISGRALSTEDSSRNTANPIYDMSVVKGGVDRGRL